MTTTLTRPDPTSGGGTGWDAPPRDHAGWAARADEVAAVLAVDALDRDRANAEPVAEAALLRRSGLAVLLTPVAFGGAGQTWATALEVVRRLARVDGSIAQLLGYHYVNIANLWLTARPEAGLLWGRRSSEDAFLWGDAVNPVDPAFTLTPDGDGYRLDGSKTFCTGASVGDVTLVAAAIAGTADGALVAVPRATGGATFSSDWDNLGQRLSASGGVTYRDVRIEDQQVLAVTGPDDGTPLASLVTPAIQAVFGHLYLGQAEGALAVARDYTRTVSRAWLLGGAASAATDPYVLATYGELAARTDAVAALAEKVAGTIAAAAGRGAELGWDERGEAEVATARLKVVSTELALDVTSRVFEVTGARATANAVGLDRFWRNVRTHTLHDPLPYKKREVGDHFLNGTHPSPTLYT